MSGVNPPAILSPSQSVILTVPPRKVINPLPRSCLRVHDMHRREAERIRKPCLCHWKFEVVALREADRVQAQPQFAQQMCDPLVGCAPPKSHHPLPGRSRVDQDAMRQRAGNAGKICVRSRSTSCGMIATLPEVNVPMAWHRFEEKGRQVADVTRDLERQDLSRPQAAACRRRRSR